VELAPGGHHARARGEDRLDLVSLELAGHVEDAVGPEGEDLVEVMGGGHPDRVEPAQLAGVDAHLVLAVDPQPDQLQPGVADDAP
jgi:hypothetical protein